MRHCTHIKFFVGVFTIFFICLGITSVEAKPDEDWPMFGHDPQHTWYTSDPGPSSGDLNWSKEGIFRGPPAVVDGKVYTASDTNVITLDASNGDIIWTYETEYAIESSPAVVGGRVYIGSVDRKLYALDAMTGGLLWAFDVDGWVNSSPTVAEGRVFFTTHLNTLYSLDASTGTELWSRRDLVFRFPPSVSNGKAYVGTADGYLLCLDASTGAEIWRHSTEGYVVSAPAVAGGRLYFSTNILEGQAITGARIYSLDTSSGEELWKKSMNSGLGSSPVVSGNRLYVGSYDFSLYSLNASNGDLLWSYGTEGAILFPPALAGDRIYFGDHEALYSLDTSTGDLTWRDYYNMVSSPVVAGSMAYVTTSDHIYCLGQAQGETPTDGTVGPSLLERPETLWVVGAAMIGLIGVALYLLRPKGEERVEEKLRW